MAEKYNMKNPSVKRILQEVKEMQANPSDDFMSLPLEENIFEWQFAIRGPRETEFEGGIYHGRIQLPAEYPFKPPSFLLLTPNGRFETQTKICLSISNYHPEHWQPSWSVRTALVALIAFMPTSPGGAIGSLDYSKEERKKLAIRSRTDVPKFGTPERQNLINQIHEYMLSKSPPVPRPTQTPNSNEAPPTDAATESSGPIAPANDTPNQESEQVPPAENGQVARVSAEAGPVRAEVRVARSETGRVVQRTQQPNSDRFFSVAALGLAAAILFLVMKKFLRSHGYSSFMESL